MSQFYITLPSNSSQTFFPDNTVTKYATQLQSAVSLDGEWEMGLSEIMFIKNWFNVHSKTDTNFVIKCEPHQIIRQPDGTTGYEGLQYRFDLSIRFGLYETPESLVAEINNTIKN